MLLIFLDQQFPGRVQFTKSLPAQGKIWHKVGSLNVGKFKYLLYKIQQTLL